MSARILIADPDASFGQMLKQILEMDGLYQVDAVTTGMLALAAARSHRPELAIIDAALGDMSPAALIASLQLTRPGISIMLIPMDSTLPEEFRQLGVRGILTKPFYVGNLSKYIADVLGTIGLPSANLPPATKSTSARQTGPLTPPAAKRPGTKPLVPPTEPPAVKRSGTKPLVPAAEPPATKRSGTKPLSPEADRRPTTPPPPVVPEPPARASILPRVRQAIASTRRDPAVLEPLPATVANSADLRAAIDRALTTLSHELRADALFVLKDNALFMQRSTLSGLNVDTLTAVLQRWSAVAADLASLVGEQSGRFAQFHAEGERYHVYAYDTGGGIILVVICRTDIPFGTLRLQLKTTGAQLSKLLR